VAITAIQAQGTAEHASGGVQGTAGAGPR
jgi:hypothetical protein